MARVKGGHDWHRRQTNDSFNQKARSDRYRSRSVYKLEQIQSKFKLIRKKDVVFDLGCAPGGWSQLLSQLAGQVVGCDLLDMKPIANVEFIKGDFTTTLIQQTLLDRANHAPDIICSDMAPNISGIKCKDEGALETLFNQVAVFTADYLKKDGHLIVKVFEGESANHFKKTLKTMFKAVVVFKPEASRSTSTEIYFIAKCKKVNSNLKKEL